MPQLPTVSGGRAISAFEAVGYRLVRTKGSHHILAREGSRHHLSVPVHGNTPLKSGLLRALIRDAGLTVEQFIELLDG
jgi:predicted RNA binding protein YcfA (HicA-like mRNA interferase family)